MLRVLSSEQTDSDTQLVEAVIDGSRDALAELYDRHAAEAYRLIYSLMRSRSDAEDVVHDLFVGLPRELRGYSGRGSLHGWLRRVSVRAALMRMRGERRRREERLADDAHLLGRGEAPIDRVALERALEALPVALRTVFVLKVVEGYSHEEIAELLGTTSGASKVRLARARRLLQELLS